MKIGLRKSVSKKTGNEYVALVGDCDYRVCLLSVDTSILQDFCEVYGKEYSQKLQKMAVDKIYTASEFVALK